MFNLTKALLSMHYLTSVLLQITTVFVPLSFLEEIPEEWVLHSIELKGRRDIWPLEMLQECQRDILIYFIFCLYKLKKNIACLCCSCVRGFKSREFVSHHVNRTLVQKSYTVWHGSNIRGDITHAVLYLQAFGIVFEFEVFLCFLYPCQVAQSMPGVWLFIT